MNTSFLVGSTLVGNVGPLGGRVALVEVDYWKKDSELKVTTPDSDSRLRFLNRQNLPKAPRTDRALPAMLD